jgi:hypothetical protein
MSAKNAPKKKPTGDYPSGYCRPPKSGEWQPGFSGNPAGKAKGQPSLAQVLVEEAARMVKVKVGDEVVHLGKERMVFRALLDKAARGDVAATRLYFALYMQLIGPSEKTDEPEAPLTEEELELLKMFSKLNKD